MPRVTRHTGIPRVVHRRAAHTLSDMIGIQDFPRSLSLLGRHRPPILRPKTFTRKPATTFLFPCFFFTCNTGSGESGLSGGSLAYLVIFSVCFSHSHSHFAARARGGGKNAPSQQQKLLVSLTGSSIIDHRVAEDQSPDRSTRHINADTRRTGHHRHRLSLQAGSWSHPRFYLFCEFDPDRMCSVRKETCRALVGWLVGLLAQSRALQCSNSLRVSSGRRWGAKIVDLSSTLRSTASFHSTKLSPSSRQISRTISLRWAHTSIRINTRLCGPSPVQLMKGIRKSFKPRWLSIISS